MTMITFEKFQIKTHQIYLFLIELILIIMHQRKK